MTPAVNQAVFHKGKRTYLVLYNKSPELVGAFFTEPRLPQVEAALPDLEVTAQAPRPSRAARELLTGQSLELTNGQVTLSLPATEWRVVEFSP